MTMTRQLLDEYLDGELAAEQCAQVEQALAQDAGAKQLLAQLQAERAQRKLVFSSYEPTEVEAHLGARELLQEMHGSRLRTLLGSVWTNRVSRIAASIVLMAGAFAAGQYSVSLNAHNNMIAVSNQENSPWVVEYPDSDGQTVSREFSDYATAQKFAQEVSHNEVLVADAGGVF